MKENHLLEDTNLIPAMNLLDDNVLSDSSKSIEDEVVCQVKGILFFRS